MPRRVRRAPVAADPPAAAAVDLERVAAIVEELDPRTNLIAAMQRLQHEYGYLPEPVVDEVARLSGVPAARIYGVATFYAQFRLSPVGRRLIDVCHGTACHVAGAERITEALEEELGIAAGKTTADGEFTLGSVACMGACSQAPVMRIGEETYGNLTPDKTRAIIRELMARVGAQRG